MYRYHTEKNKKVGEKGYDFLKRSALAHTIDIVGKFKKLFLMKQPQILTKTEETIQNMS